MAMKTGDEDGPKAEINITPLVDVVLVLLIIFMVVTPVLRMGYKVSVPPTRSDIENPMAPPEQLILRLEEDGSLYINKEQVPPQEFVSRLQMVLKGRGSEVTFLAANGQIPYEKVMAFIDLCHDHGVGNIGVVLHDLPDN